MESLMPITAKEVVTNAFKFFFDFYPNESEVRLEEVKPMETGWIVTLSFPDSDTTGLAHVMAGPRRIYKDISVDEAGNATGFTIRVI